MDDNPYPIVRVSEWNLREMFNGGHYWEKAESGELAVHIRRNVHLTQEKAQKANEPYCTCSQEISYLDQSNLEVVRLHQYLREDGSIGAWGKPDPKRMLVDGVLYRLRPLTWYEKIYSFARRWLYRIFRGN